MSQTDVAVEAENAAEIIITALERMRRSARSWAIWLLVIGGISLVASGLLDPVWGLLLIGVGLVSFRIQEPAMFMVYAVMLAWAGLSNILSGDGRWIVAGLFQFYLAFLTGREFLAYRHLYAIAVGSDPTDPSPRPLIPNRTRTFAVLGLVLAVLSLCAGPTVFVAAILATEDAGSEPPQLLVNLVEATIDVTVLALGLSLGALLAGRSLRLLAGVGAALSFLTLVGWLGLSILP